MQPNGEQRELNMQYKQTINAADDSFFCTHKMHSLKGSRDSHNSIAVVLLWKKAWISYIYICNNNKNKQTRSFSSYLIGVLNYNETQVHLDDDDDELERPFTLFIF